MTFEMHPLLARASRESTTGQDSIQVQRGEIGMLWQKLDPRANGRLGQLELANVALM